MPGTAAELSSLTTSLEELVQRITALAEEASAAKRDDVAGELFEVERTLQSASRRLTRLLDR